jgi:hypothetical protein
MSITLVHSSSGDELLRSLRADAGGCSVVVTRCGNGAEVLKALIVSVAEGSPRSLGCGECRWDLRVAEIASP